jgi:hypothetical protein
MSDLLLYFKKIYKGGVFCAVRKPSRSFGKALQILDPKHLRIWELCCREEGCFGKRERLRVLNPKHMQDDWFLRTICHPMQRRRFSEEQVSDWGTLGVIYTSYCQSQGCHSIGDPTFLESNISYIVKTDQRVHVDSLPSDTIRLSLWYGWQLPIKLDSFPRLEGQLISSTITLQCKTTSEHGNTPTIVWVWVCRSRQVEIGVSWRIRVKWVKIR